MKRIGWSKILSIIGALILVFMSTFWTVPVKAEDSKTPVSAGSKVSSLLSLHIKMKLAQPDASPQSTMKPFGMESESSGETTLVASEIVFLYFAQPPTDEQISDLASLGVTVYPDSWIPPVNNFKTGFLLADMPVDKLDVLAVRDYVAKLDTAEESSKPQNDVARSTMGVNSVWSSGYTGAGVTVAVLDSGIDASNSDFPSLNTSNSKDYSNYPSLDDSIANVVTGTGHGTHVAGSLLGRGTNNINYQGVAPGANLVFLKIGNDTDSNSTSAAITAAIRAAVDVYHARIINISYGGWSQYHDGSDAECQAVDYATSKGTTVFAGAGNYASDGWHCSGTIAAHSTSADIPINVASGESSYLHTNLVWYDGMGLNVSLSMQYYNSSHIQLNPTNSGTSESSKGTQSCQYRFNSLQNSGTYYLRVQNNSNSSQFFHIYYMGGSSNVYFASSDSNYTLSSPAEADSAIAVGNYSTRMNWTDYKGNPWHYTQGSADSIAPSSSCGPRVDTGAPRKPDIVAPGRGIISVRDRTVYPWPAYNSSADAYPYENYIIDNDGSNLNGSGPADYLLMGGTSMASPMAAGVGALLLSKNPTMSPAQMKQVLENTATDKGSGGADNIYGYGLINASAAISSINTVKQAFTSSVQVLVAGSPSSVITVQVQDSSNTPINVPVATAFNLSSTSGSGVFSLNNSSWANISSVTIPAGSNSAGFYYKDSAIGTPTLSVAAAGFITGTQQETIFPKLSVSGYPASIAGSQQGFSVTIQDGSNNAITGYTGTIHFTSSDNQPVLPPDYTFTGSGTGKDNGTHNFSATLKTAGTQSITATDTVTAVITGVQGGISISPAVKNKLVWSTHPPATVTAGDIWTAFTVKITDQYDNQTADTDTVTLVPASGSLNGILNKPAIAGLATFSDISRTVSGNLTLTATSGSLIAAPASNKVEIHPASVTSFAVSGYTLSSIAGTTHDFSISSQDTYGNTNPAYSGTVHLTCSDSQGELPGDYTFTGSGTGKDNGTHSFSATLKTAGNQSIIATDKLNSNITGTQSNILVNPAEASQLNIETAADGTKSLVTSRYIAASSSFTAYAVSRDQFNNLVSNVSGNWTLASISGNVTDSDLVPVSGNQSAIFTGHGIGSAQIQVVSGNFTADSGTLTVVPRFNIIGFPSSINAGVSGNFTVTALDGYDAFVADYSGTIHFTSTDSHWEAPPDSPLVSGNGTFSATLKTAGIQTIFATDTAISTIAGNQSNITITPAAPSQVRVETAADGSGTIIPAQTIKGAEYYDTTLLKVGDSLTGYAITRDRFGNFVANAAAAWSLTNKTVSVAVSDLVPAVDSKSATFTGHDSGTATIHAAVSGLDSTVSGLLTIVAIHAIDGQGGGSPGGNGGGGGGGGGAAPTPEAPKPITVTGMQGSADLNLDDYGRAQSAVQLKTDDGNAVFDIPKDTMLCNSLGSPLTGFSAKVLTSPPSPPPQKAVLLAYEFSPEGAVFTPPITLSLTLDPQKLPEGTVGDSVTLAYWDGKQWVTVDSKIENGVLKAKISHFSQWALIGKVVPPAKFSLSDLKLSANTLNPGEALTIQTTVSNTGGSSGKYAVTLKVNYAIISSQEITLEAGGSQNLTFTFSKDTPGDYTIEVNGKTAKFTVAAPAAVKPPPMTPLAVQAVPAQAPLSTPVQLAPAPESKPTMPLMWPILGIIIILGLAIGGVIIWRQRKKA